MINHKQLKVSIILGVIIFGIQLLIGSNSYTGLYQQIHPVFSLFKTELWYIPILYPVHYLKIICDLRDHLFDFPCNQLHIELF